MTTEPHVTAAGGGSEPGRGAQTTRLSRAAVVLLVVVACLTFTASVAGLWASRNFLDTDRFVSRAAPLIDEPEVQQAISTRLTVQLMAVIDPGQLFEEVLPERGAILAVPLTDALEGFVGDQVDAFVASDAFARLWEGALRVAHETSATLLRDRGGEVLAVEGGQVTLNLVPVIRAVLEEIGAATPELLGREIDLPELTIEDLPATAIARLEDALDVELGEDYGQFTVYADDQLGAVQDAVSLFDRLVVVLLPLSVACAALAVWLSRSRRRTVLQLAGGVAIGMVLLRRVAFAVTSEVTSLPPTRLGRDAAAVVVDAFADPLLTFAGWVLTAAAAVLAVAYVTGGSPSAVALRHRLEARGSARAAAGGGRYPEALAWVADRRDGLLVGGVAAGLLLLWTADLGWVGLAAVLIGVLAFEAFVYATGARVAAQAAAS